MEHTALQLRASEERQGKLGEQLKKAEEIIVKENDKKTRLDQELAKKNKNLEQAEKQRQKLEQENVAIMQNMIFDSVFEVDSVLENKRVIFNSC